MKLELKKIAHYERLSEETNAYNADVYLDGVRCMAASNDDYEVWIIPSAASGVLYENLSMDCESIGIEKELRADISKAMSAVHTHHVTAPIARALRKQLTTDGKH